MTDQPAATRRARSYTAAAAILAERDPVMRRLVAEAGPARVRPPTDSHFGALVRAIVYQQLAGRAAAAIHGRLIAALKALSDASGLPSDSRESQCDVVLVAASLVGLALLARSGRLQALGFAPDEMIARLDSRFRGA